MDKNCCVCMSLTQSYEKLEDTLLLKLKFVTPEVDWCLDSILCFHCISQLETAFLFKQLCMKLNEKNITSKEIFNCFNCNASFDSKDTLISHLGNHTVNEDADHSTTKQKKREFSCEICTSVYKSSKAVIEHCINDHSMDRKLIRPFVCQECPMKFTSSTNLTQHKKYHSGNRSHVCTFCGKAFITKSDLTFHEYIHYDRRNYKCEFCQKAFNTNKNLRTHIYVVHTDSKLWKHQCTICDKRFPLKSGFVEHTKRHKGEKNFSCHICSKTFISNNELRKHIIHHSTTQMFHCQHCDRTYKVKRLLDRHLAKIHGIGEAQILEKVKKFGCHLCSSSFGEKNKLERHLRTHSGEKPHHCSKCDKKFSDKWYLNQHLKTVHKVV